MTIKDNGKKATKAFASDINLDPVEVIGDVGRSSLRVHLSIGSSVEPILYEEVAGHAPFVHEVILA